ncbi:hypothetical protein RHMOL_Rhmol02G0309600 [Rhododendron molle]|uniref:Uncharacterized protein n=1 Tax=Rhododendron molle TaxID=49168 RepID=A0ACC0PVS3_RHOML|nr:hypothetical protein RHMOL_Rhmol02G0309600 [Rhododendron molle]
MPIDGSVDDADNFADLIRHALQKLIFKKELSWHLIQFWAPTKAYEGRTLLTTQFQPFAIGTAEYTPDHTRKLCEYRMGMCREYNNSFHADAECAEEQLGLPGRVFLHQFPESIPFVMHYSLTEYPQRNLALRCFINGSCAVPVFDHSSHTCVGVLEIVSLHFPDAVSYDKSFVGQMYDIFQHELHCSLVQFWAATKTSEGRTLLTTQFQPFALGPTAYGFPDERNRLCEYRMGMCREYNNSFYADAECAEQQLGLPGRVFLHQFPESTPNVELYTLKEYPQRHLALRCKIGSSLALPVFEHSSHTCVGVLEIVSLSQYGEQGSGFTLACQIFPRPNV